MSMESKSDEGWDHIDFKREIELGERIGGGGVGVGGANQHFFGLPTGLFCGPRLGEVGHIPADSDGVDQADDGPSFTSLECHRPHMEGVMHIIGFA